MACRLCDGPTEEVLDLGASPPANALKQAPDELQTSYPLVLEWCRRCSNLQLRDTVAADVLYRDYLYVTPASPSLTVHYQDLLNYLSARGIADDSSFVLEIGSNVGLFLSHIRDSVGEILGVDPAERIAAMATAAGVPTIAAFFDQEVAARIRSEHGPADVVVARHCLAHNASPQPMLEGAVTLLGDDGRLLIENAYAVDTIERGEFDQIYHEHMFYYSVSSMRSLLTRHGLKLVDAWTAPVHGGSIVFVASRDPDIAVDRRVDEFQEREARTLNRESLGRFAHQAHEARKSLESMIRSLRREGASIYGYGATAKGTTLLNFAGLTAKEIPYCVDNTPMKHGRFLPLSNIEVISEERAFLDPPDYFLLTAWNYESEIVSKVRAAGNKTSRFIVPIPEPRVVGRPVPDASTTARSRR